MSKIVLYLGHKARGKFEYFRIPSKIGVYSNISKGNFVELTPRIQGCVSKITVSEPDDTKYVYILTDTEHELNQVLSYNSRWELLREPLPHD